MNIIKYLLLSILITTCMYAEKQDVTLQLQWKHQFQFAGYYMAKEKGFYEEVNLNVQLLEYRQGTDIFQNVLSKKINYATGRVSLINKRSAGKKVVLLASILQSSPLALVAKKSSKIKSLQDFKNKNLTITTNEAETSIFPMLLSQQIMQDQLNINESTTKLNDLINDKTDIITLYTSNQEYTLIKQGVEYNIFHPKDYDFDFYDDILYTSEEETKVNRQRTYDFTLASLKGWEYAFNNIDETIDIILKKYNTQNKTRDELIYEANVLKKLAYKDNIKLGTIEKNKIQRIYDIYHLMGFTKSPIDLDKFIFNTDGVSIEFTQEEKAFLKKHNNTITAHNELNWPPYNFNINGKATGYSIDYMNLIASKLNINVNYIQGDSWSKFMQMFKSNKLDVMLNIVKTTDRSKFMDFTSDYGVSTKSIFTNNTNIHTLNDLTHKKVSVQKDSFSHLYLKKNYPKIDLLLSENAYDSIITLINGNVDATIENFAVANNILQQNSLSVKYSRVPEDPNMKSNLHIGTLKNNKVLNSILEKGIQSIQENELIVLKKKWLGEVSIIQELPNTYSQKEKNYLKSHQTIKMCNNPNWEPIEYAEHDNMSKMAGISIDTLHKIEQQLNIKFQNVPTKNWSESQLYLKEKKCDILPSAIKTAKREKYANFTQPYLALPLAIFTEKGKSLVNSLSDIIDKSWSRQKGSGLIEYMKSEYPNNKLVLTNTINEAFQFVNNGTTYFTIETLPVASHLIHKYQLNNIQIAGYSNIMYKLSIAVRDDDLMLRDILDKALANISKKEHKEILQSWTIKKDRSFINPQMLRNIFIILFIVAVLLVYRQYLLKKANSNLKNLVDKKTHELKELNLHLEIRIKKAIQQNREKDKLLDTQSKMASMGEMIGNIAHQWRQPLSVISTGVTGMQLQKEYNLLDDQQFNKTCEMINDNVQYLSKTIDDFKNFIQGNREKKFFNLAENLNTFLHLVEGSIKENNIDIILHIDKDLEINGYENELAQCLINIFNNSKDALKEKKISYKLIIISAYKNSNQIILNIQDNAKGIPEDIISKVFEPYFTTKHKFQGTGLGLNMTYKLIVDGMKGNITVQNKTFSHNNITYTGALFQITLPMN